MTENLREAFGRRFRNLVERSKQWEKAPPDKLELWLKLYAHYNNEFKCLYCGEQLRIGQPSPALNVFSFDHSLPFALGGDNALGNIVICCHACNIIKGTMDGPTFTGWMRAARTTPGLKERIYLESWRGKLASKLERVELERTH